MGGMKKILVALCVIITVTLLCFLIPFLFGRSTNLNANESVSTPSLVPEFQDETADWVDVYAATLDFNSIDFSNTQNISTSDEFDKYVDYCRNRQYHFIVMHLSSADLRLEPASFVDRYAFRFADSTWQEDAAGGVDVLYKVTYFSGERIAYAYLTGDLSDLSEEESKVYGIALKWLSENIQPWDTDFDKEVKIIEYICAQSAYSNKNFTTEYLQNLTDPYGLLVEGKANCQGYADTFEMLSEMCGMDCIKIVGQTVGTHMWNMIRLDGTWCMVDPTFADSTHSNKVVAYEYINTPKSIFSIDHTWDELRFPEVNGAHFYFDAMHLTVYNEEDLTDELITPLLSGETQATVLIDGNSYKGPDYQTALSELKEYDTYFHLLGAYTFLTVVKTK